MYLNEYYLAHIEEDKHVCDPYAKW
jgi:hypothetical protein